jgi:hypothetical protein
VIHDYQADPKHLRERRARLDLNRHAKDAKGGESMNGKNGIRQETPWRSVGMKWWKAIDEKITAYDRRDARERGCRLGPLSYRRRFVCPFCGHKTATETFRDQYFGRKAKRIPSIHFQCRRCCWGRLAGPKEVANEMASNKANWERSRIVVFGAPDIEAPNIRPLTVRCRRMWRRTDPQRQRQPETHADYPTVTQAATATEEQHLELAVEQSLQKSPPRELMIFPQVSHHRSSHG